MVFYSNEISVMERGILQQKPQYNIKYYTIEETKLSFLGNYNMRIIYKCTGWIIGGLTKNIK